MRANGDFKGQMANGKIQMVLHLPFALCHLPFEILGAGRGVHGQGVENRLTLDSRPRVTRFLSFSYFSTSRLLDSSTT
jgi:hypothetical protein